MADSPFMLRPAARAAPPGFPPDVAPNQIIYAAHINAIRDSVAVWPGNVNGNGKTLSGAASIGSAIVETPKLQSAADLTFNVGAGYPERVRLTAAGNVGIGTVSPGARCDVVGPSPGGQMNALRWARDDEISLGYLTTDPVGYLSGAIAIYRNNAANTFISANGKSYFMGGNVGIGTADPDAMLDVEAATGDFGIVVGGGVSTTGYEIGRQSSGGAAIGFLRFHGRQPGFGGFAFSNASNGQIVLILNNGGIVLNFLPAANPGAGSKQLWYDPADGNRVKFAA